MTRVLLAAVAVATLAILAISGSHGASAKRGGGLAPLSGMAVPTPPQIDRFIRDTTAARQLGKALFWDMQAGSDGRTACASCHFNAGADNRSRNQVNPHGGSFAGKGPNGQLTAADFPIAGEEVVGSQGVVPSTFRDVLAGDALDSHAFAPTDAAFHVGAVNVRRTTGRNTPSAVNAVFNFRNFWDGRAQNTFNGVNPLGAGDPGARVGQVGPGGAVDRVAVSLTNSSLASQATGPPGNPVEMSAEGRTLSDIGRKLLTLRPLGAQRVSASDSLLGGMVASGRRGLDTTYGDLVRRAFRPEWWDSSASLTGANGRVYSLMQFNFSLYWGLAIQAYEATLVSDRTPLDRFLEGDPAALGPQAREGLGVFTGKGDCTECHNGAALTDATAPAGGFHDIGVRPQAGDPGLFKTAGLRNVALTAPYFHNGSRLSLRQVVDFYSRGGDFAPAEIQPLGLTDTEKDALVAFLESLTDPRVRDQSAPFDHPQLFVPVGAQAKPDGSLLTDAEGRALDCFRELPATGASGGEPLAAFPAFTGPPCDPVPAGDGGGPPDTAVPASTPGVARIDVTLAGRTCASRRKVILRLRAPRHDRIRRVMVAVDGRPLRSVRGHSLRHARIDLRGLPRGVVRVRIVAHTAKGRERVLVKRYRTCSGH
jgi:cytochrome c peroxidase